MCLELYTHTLDSQVGLGLVTQTLCRRHHATLESQKQAHYLLLLCVLSHGGGACASGSLFTG